MRQHDDIRIALQQKLEQLRQRLGKIEQNLRETPEPDSEEQALGRENDEVLERLDNSSRNEIAMIEEAMARIASGKYDVCNNCGDTISVQRLKALPYTTTCIKCAN